MLSPLPRLTCLVMLIGIAVSHTAHAQSETSPQPPRIVGTAHANESALVTQADGTIVNYFTDMDASVVRSVKSTDGGQTWSEPADEFATGDTHHAVFALIDHAGDTHAWYLDKRRTDNERRRINENYYIDVLHRRKSPGGSWSEPSLVFEGYTGALLGAIESEPGRLLVPIGAWNTPDDEVEPQTGNNTITLVVSDDAGSTWRRTDLRLTSPVYAGYNGANYGAIEPAITSHLGRYWLMYRTQTGFMYESFSEDGLTGWSEPKPSRFRSTNSPNAFLPLRDGRMILFWNNCEMPPRHNGDGVYGGRDAMHAAIYQDGEWHGFREVYRDVTRNDTPPKRGDRGTAYPAATQADDGRVVLITGQGEHARRVITFEPDWLTQTSASCDFADGLEQWVAFTPFGPAERWWRDRRVGPSIADAPDADSGRVMHLRDESADDYAADGATWNFPAGRSGTLTMRVKLNPGFGGATVSLIDRLFEPTDPTVTDNAMFTLDLSGERVPVGDWVELVMAWDLKAKRCEVSVDGEALTTLPLNNQTPNGVSYVHLRSTPDGEADPAGMLIDRVSAAVE